jgi:Ca-activated chloride channel family protein
MLLDLAHPELFAGQSTSIKKCLALAFRAMRASKTQKKLLLLVSDGEDHDAQALDLAQEAAQKGFVIYTIGVGTRSGGPIPLLNALGEIGDWKRDEKKRLIYSKLNPALLQAIASATNGRYFELTKGAEAINAILKTKDSLDKKQFEQTKYVEYIEWSPAFIGLALALCFLELLVPPHRQFAPLRQASQDIRALCQRWVRFFKE